MPITRSRGKPVSASATPHITSSGLETTITKLWGATRRISRATDWTMPAFVFTRSSRLIPGFRAIPAVTMNSSAPAASS